MARPFLTARWEHLVLLNYVCPRELLEPLVPEGTVLDEWDGHTLVSLVGFLFRDTLVRGIPLPFHRTFEEVNLRFYVRRTTPSGVVRRAVVFIRELVPRLAIATVARYVYNEPYVAVPMSHDVALSADTGGSATYSWRYRGHAFSLGAEVSGAAHRATEGSEAAFITEHYWGYTRQRDASTMEYEVEHPAWQVWESRSATFSGPSEHLYGPRFAEVLSPTPRSAFVAVGSHVAVHLGKPLPRERAAPFRR